MSISTFIVFACLCTIAAYLFVKLAIVYPAWKRHKVQDAATVLSKCLKHLNSDALPSAKIKNGHYLHDKFYNLLYFIYTNDNPIIKSTANIIHTEKIEQERKKFRNEINNLDPETRAIIDESLAAIAQILWLHNPLKFIICIVKSTTARGNFEKGALKKQMVRDGEYLTVRELDDVISLNKHCHA